MPDAKSQTAIKILDYLKRNPDAEDSVEGIFRWWLPSQHIEENKERVHEALTDLVAKNLVLKRKHGDVWTFRLNHDKDSIISVLIEWMSE
jgi:hypothetical protein